MFKYKQATAMFKWVLLCPHLCDMNRDDDRVESRASHKNKTVLPHQR